MRPRELVLVEREENREEKILITLITVCLFLLPIAFLSFLKMPLYGLLALLESLYLLVSSRRIKTSDIDLALVGMSALLFAYLLVRWIAGGLDGGERLVQTALMLLTLVSFSRYRWDADSIHLLFGSVAFIVLTSLAYWFISGRITNYYSSFYGHANGFALVIIAALAITALDAGSGRRFSHYIIVSICIILILFANSRSAILTIAVSLVCAAVIGTIKKRGKSVRKAAGILFFTAVLFALVFSAVYPMLYGTDIGFYLEHLSREYLNKNFFSGRQLVWQMIIDTLQGHELYGLGLSMVPSMIYDTGFSSHNLYLQTILQSGVIGLVLLLGLLWTVLKRLATPTSGGVIGAALLISMAVHDCFEVSLTQNNIDFALIIWAIFGICIAVSQVKNNI